MKLIIKLLFRLIAPILLFLRAVAILSIANLFLLGRAGLARIQHGGRGGMWPGRLTMQLKLVFTQYRIIRVPLYSRANRTISGRIPPGKVDFHDHEDQGRGSRQCPHRRIYQTGNGAECKAGPVGAMLLAC